jgi:hypothetical protein
MRSELIYRAVAQVPNRFLPAKYLANAARALHKPGTRIEETTNEALARICGSGTNGNAQPFPDLRVPLRRRMRSPGLAHLSKGSAVSPLEDLRAF